jgi:hypothetical protein
VEPTLAKNLKTKMLRRFEAGKIAAKRPVSEWK